MGEFRRTEACSAMAARPGLPTQAFGNGLCRQGLLVIGLDEAVT